MANIAIVKLFSGMFMSTAQLLGEVEREARRMGLEQVFVLTTQTAHWFLEQGFVEKSLDDLPGQKQALYNLQRNSKVFFKRLSI